MNQNLIAVSLKDVFGLSDAGDRKVPGFEVTEQTKLYIPTSNTNYVFRKDSLRDLLAFLMRPRGDAMWITGPTGSGKTSIVLETAARLNWPVTQVTCHGSLEFLDLKGQFILKSDGSGQQPSMRYQYGPLATAMKYGHILILNEVDLMDPGELAGMNDVLEGRPLFLPECNEVIEPHPNFRLVATANSAGNGDATGLYQGIQSQNIAAMDRYRVLEIDYPDKAIEESILAKIAPQILPAIRSKMVQMAEEIRSAFKGSDGVPGRLSVTMSTRTLVRWAQLALDMAGADNALKYALGPALANRCTPEERMAIEEIAQTVFGSDWEVKKRH